VKTVSTVVAALTASLAAGAPATAPARANARVRTGIAELHLHVVLEDPGQEVRDELRFTACEGPGALLVHVAGQSAVARIQRRRCQRQTIAWDAPLNPSGRYRASVRVRIGARSWSRTLTARASGPEGGLATVIVTSADLRHALARMRPIRFGPIRRRRSTIHVVDGVRYQRILGFGAAMTDTSAWLLYDELPPARRARVMDALFSRRGIGLDYMRVPIGASDFTATGTPYTYDDMPAGQTDPGLAHFSIAHDRRYILPALRMMLALSPNMQIVASPWSAPAWMKANQSLDDVGYAGVLLRGEYQAYADYLARFVQAYAAAGVPISAVTPANEAHTPSMYPGMDLDEDTFLVDYLTPTLRAAGLDTSVYALDGSGFAAAQEELTSGPVRDAVAGIAWHCYAGLEQMSALHSLDPSASLIMDECSPGIVSYPTPEILIASLRNDAQAVDLWNLALDPSGGPKQQAPGCLHCRGVVTVHENTRSARLNLNYYQLGQVSKFVEPGARRVESDRWVSDFSNADGTYGVTRGLDDVALVNPDGSNVLVAYDNSSRPVTFQVVWGREAFSYTLAARATVTFVWR
jgi:glucosylceramidase